MINDAIFIVPKGEKEALISLIIYTTARGHKVVANKSTRLCAPLKI